MTSPTAPVNCLTATARRRVLVTWADDYNAEQNRNDRPFTAALPTLLPLMCAAHLTPFEAVHLFTEFACERAVLGKAWTSYDRCDEAEARAERLLDQLVGEAA